MKAFTAFVLTAIPVLLACWVQLVSPIDPVVPDVDLPPLRELARDQRLVDAQLLFAGDVSGPESFAAAPDALYTGLADGRIVRLIHGEITKLNPIRRLEVETIARTGEALEGCGTRELEPACGRPLGLRIARARDIAPGCETDELPCRADEKVLVVCDAYKGLLMVTGLGRQGPDRSTVIPLATRADADAANSSFSLLNDVVVGAGGTVSRCRGDTTRTTQRFPAI